MSKRRKDFERPPGSYSALCHQVIDSAAYQNLSRSAKAMFIEALRQHNGYNNGRLQLSSSWLGRRGWRSADTIARAKAELVSAGLLFKTRQGGLHMGPDWFAITYLPISDASGLDISVDAYQRQVYGQWTGIKAPVRLPDQSAPVSGTVRSDGWTVTSSSAPKVGPTRPPVIPAAASIGGDNVIAIPYAAPEGLAGVPAKYPQ